MPAPACPSPTPPHSTVSPMPCSPRRRRAAGAAPARPAARHRRGPVAAARRSGPDQPARRRSPRAVALAVRLLDPGPRGRPDPGVSGQRARRPPVDARARSRSGAGHPALGRGQGPGQPIESSAARSGARWGCAKASASAWPEVPPSGPPGQCPAERGRAAVHQVAAPRPPRHRCPADGEPRGPLHDLAGQRVQVQPGRRQVGAGQLRPPAGPAHRSADGAPRRSPRPAAGPADRPPARTFPPGRSSARHQRLQPRCIEDDGLGGTPGRAPPAPVAAASSCHPVQGLRPALRRPSGAAPTAPRGCRVTQPLQQVPCAVHVGQYVCEGARAGGAGSSSASSGVGRFVQSL